MEAALNREEEHSNRSDEDKRMKRTKERKIKQRIIIWMLTGIFLFQTLAGNLRVTALAAGLEQGLSENAAVSGETDRQNPSLAVSQEDENTEPADEKDAEPSVSTEPESTELQSETAAEEIKKEPQEAQQAEVPAENPEKDKFQEFMEEQKENSLEALAEDRDIMAVVYLCHTYELLEEPELSAEPVGEVDCGQTVFVLEAADRSGSRWIRVRALVGGDCFEGWIERSRLAISDERFLQWEKENPVLKAPVRFRMMLMTSAVPTDISMFPESYQGALSALKEKHPDWIFVPMETGIDWNTAITEELKGGKSLISKAYPEWTREGHYGQGTWYLPSREVLEFFMDPRNHLSEDTVFQFEQLTYNESYHTLEAMQSFLTGTFMDSVVPGLDEHMTFAYTLYMIARERKESGELERDISPFHLAARILQEQGSKGTSPLISGTYPGYEGYYNYFNIGASGKTNEEVIENGLKTAREKWKLGAYSALCGGADILCANYIKRGQDTLYLEKFNVNPNAQSAVYTHQYMQNITAPVSEAYSMKKLYASAGKLNSPFVFKIPVFQNMPASACPMPEASTNVVLDIPEGYTGTQVIIENTVYNAEKRNGKLIVKLADNSARTAGIEYKDANGKVEKTKIWDLVYEGNRYIASEWTEEPAPNSVILNIPDGYADTQVIVDNVAYNAEKRNGKLVVRLADNTAKSAKIVQKDEKGAVVKIHIWDLSCEGTQYIATKWSEELGPYSLMLDAPAGYTDTRMVIDDVVYQAVKYNGKLILNLPDQNAKTLRIDLKDADGKLSKILIWDLTYDGTEYHASKWEEELGPYSLILDLPEGIAIPELWLDGVGHQGVLHGRKLVYQENNPNAGTVTIYRYGPNGAQQDMYVWTLHYGENGYEVKEQPGLQGLICHRGFTIRIKGYSGLRYICGLSYSARKALMNEGIDGYKLKEYGTLALPEDMRDQYQMVKGGDKVSMTMAYGKKEDGQTANYYYEIDRENNKFYYSSLMKNIPVKSYKRAISFRGYIVLEKEGEEIILYSAPGSRDIYSMAETYLSRKIYEEGSEEDVYLKKIVSDADALK